MMRCPACKRQLTTEDIAASSCPRCAADLESCLDAIRYAEQLAQQALNCLPEDPDTAFKLVSRSRALHNNGQAKRVYALTCLCAADYASAYRALFTSQV